MSAWEQINRRIIRCDACPRLREHCRQIAAEKRRAYADWTYWGRPIPNFGDPEARLLIVGLAPAAHGANRTGRMFTGDRSGEWLYRALHKAGFANQAAAIDRNDGLTLTDCAITAVTHCAPPDNKPMPAEVANCGGFFQATFDAVPARVILALGQIAWNAVVDEARRREWLVGRRPKFAHGAEVALKVEGVLVASDAAKYEERATNSAAKRLLGSFHPSQQNTFTGRLTEPMLDAVFTRAKAILECD